MKKNLTWLTIFSFVLPIFFAPNLSAQPPENPEKKIFLAVLDLKNNAGLKNEECSTLSDAVRQELFSTGKYRIVDRENMDQILKEQGLQVSDCTSEECAVKIGQLLGVEKMVVGSIGKLGQVYMLNLQLLNVETGEIEKMVSDECPCMIEQLPKQIRNLAQQISGPSLPPTTGGIKVSSSPIGATAFINENDAGKTPLSLTNLKPGDYQIKLVLEGYEPFKDKISIVVGKVNEKIITLKEIPKPSPIEVPAKIQTEKKKAEITPKSLPANLLSINKKRKAANIASISGLGLAAVGVGAAVLFKMRSDSEYKNYKNATLQVDMDRFWNKSESSQLISNIGWGIAGTGLVTAAIALFAKPKLPDGGKKISQNELSKEPLNLMVYLNDKGIFFSVKY